VDEVEQRYHEVEVWMGWRDGRREQRWMRWSSGIMRCRCGWGGERDVLWDGTNVVEGWGRKGETVNGRNLCAGLMGEGGAGALVFFV
jgi:hypothetical protein